MVQPSLLPPSLEACEQQATQATTARRSWLRFFFTEDQSPDNYMVRAQQERAVWIGIALILQALNEIDHRLYMPYLLPYGSLIPLGLILGSFAAMLMALRPLPRRSQQRTLSYPFPRRWQRIVLILILLTSLVGVVELGRGIVMCFLPPEFTNDGTTLDTNAAALLLSGHNPYSDSNFVSIARTFAIQPEWTTPLRQGRFANRLDYPSDAELEAAFSAALKSGQAPEFEGKVSYPALSFLTLVPFVLLHSPLRTVNVLPLYLLSYLLIIAIAWRVARQELRPWVLLLGLANVPMWVSTTGANLDIFCCLLLLLAWLLRERGWLSALLLGLAIATKQPAWFSTPFYLIMVWRLYQPWEAVRRLGIAALTALTVNLPFIVWNPGAFVAGVLAPLNDPMFPLGVGIINLSATHLIPYLPEKVYLVFELIAMAAALIWYWQICRSRPEAAFFLAVVPLFFAWRSLSSYFYCAAFPLFVLQVARLRRKATVRGRGREHHPVQRPGSGEPFPVLGEQRPLPALSGRAALQPASAGSGLLASLPAVETFPALPLQRQSR
ncbi:hypothetical protein [Thermogemmatispora sp.]|uniref:hypothetical protein n=1 Tax=Thermogemmatispora sp. TaxID=1968838 RepID=UPI001DB0E859|nr:hypothetical protein [Thermogemmatispora sp.]MBX5449291.1 hypothetical protein [Thermogemmatispora sp.]